MSSQAGSTCRERKKCVEPGDQVVSFVCEPHEAAAAGRRTSELSAHRMPPLFDQPYLTDVLCLIPK